MKEKESPSSSPWATWTKVRLFIPKELFPLDQIKDFNKDFNEHPEPIPRDTKVWYKDAKRQDRRFKLGELSPHFNFQSRRSESRGGTLEFRHIFRHRCKIHPLDSIRMPVLRRKIVGKKISGTISSFTITAIIHSSRFYDGDDLGRSIINLRQVKMKRFREQTLPARLKSALFSGSV